MRMYNYMNKTEDGSAIKHMYVASKDTETHRVCGMCGELKPVEEFYKDGKNSNGNTRYRRDCKDCYKAARMMSYKKGGK